MLIDEVDITLKAGNGGAGKVSFYPGTKSGPDGGNGGRGGDVYVEAVSDLFALNQFSSQKNLSAENGSPGGRNRKSGKNGKDLTVYLPIGCELTDQMSKEIITLSEIGQKRAVCRGGNGGKGNYELRSPTNTTPKYAQPGQPGKKKEYKIVLKLIADFGLIGLPNAGKSSLLNELIGQNHAKVGNYPFTTLEPNLGVLNGKIIADIPGLIEGAAEGKGLGIKFLKHIEKVKLLLHCIDSSSEDVSKDYQVVTSELKKFNPELIHKEQIILLTKSDLVESDQLKTEIPILKKFKHKVIPISIHDLDSINTLKKLLQEY